MARVRRAITRLFSRENRWALAIAALLVLLTVLTASAAPLWIYQGF
ncbi:hypothetical protein DIM_02740 [Candidatus Denitrolinea symbiosum]|jgi:hypothetical protein|nr:hypothetical protein DIM_02740 [Candidatus Denitrolinea symbiosum]